jgi:uncharacterized protein YjbI with pentapeptide repeats
MTNRPGPGDSRGTTGRAGWVALVVVAVVAIAATGMAVLFGKYQSWNDLTSGQATLLASGGAIVAASIALWGAWVTRRGAQINTENQIWAEQERLHQQLQAQTDQLDKQLTAQREQLAQSIENEQQSRLLVHQRETARDLRSRYTTVAEQLAHESAKIRVAGIYALAALADDWYSFGSERERQVCIDLLCAQLRDLDWPSVAEEQRQLRDVIVKVIHMHTEVTKGQLPEPNWCNSRLDMHGAHLAGAQLPKAVLSEPILDDCDLSNSNLVGVQLKHAHMRRVTLSGALLTYAWFKQCDLTEAVIKGDTNVFGISYDKATLWPSGFTPPPSRVDVDDAD